MVVYLNYIFWVALELIKVNDKVAKKSQFVDKKSIVQIYASKIESFQKDYEVQAKKLHIEVIYETNDFLSTN